jgi:outer membrane protein assembly factor BamD (BamD/ComL family)
MRTVVHVLAQALAIAFLLGTPVGHAQSTASNKARARELYTQGQQLFRQGDFAAAQRSFEDAYRAVPNPVVLLSVAECQVRAEDFAGALSSLRQYLTEKPTAPDRSRCAPAATPSR